MSPGHCLPPSPGLYGPVTDPCLGVLLGGSSCLHKGRHPHHMPNEIREKNILPLGSTDDLQQRFLGPRTPQVHPNFILSHVTLCPGGPGQNVLTTSHCVHPVGMFPSMTKRPGQDMCTRLRGLEGCLELKTAPRG